MNGDGYYKGNEFGDGAEGPIAGWEETPYEHPRCDYCSCIHCICNRAVEGTSNGTHANRIKLRLGHIRCKFCGESGLHWYKDVARVLRQPDRTAHVCTTTDL